MYLRKRKTLFREISPIAKDQRPEAPTIKAKLTSQSWEIRLEANAIAPTPAAKTTRVIKRRLFIRNLKKRWTMITCTPAVKTWVVKLAREDPKEDILGIRIRLRAMFITIPDAATKFSSFKFPLAVKRVPKI